MKKFEQFNLLMDSEVFKIKHVLEEEMDNPYSERKIELVVERRYPVETIEEVKSFYKNLISPSLNTPKGCPEVDFVKLEELLGSDLTLSISIYPESIVFRSFVDLTVSEDLCGLLHIALHNGQMSKEEHHVNEKTISLSEVFKYPE